MNNKQILLRNRKTLLFAVFTYFYYSRIITLTSEGKQKQTIKHQDPASS